MHHHMRRRSPMDQITFDTPQALKAAVGEFQENLMAILQTKLEALARLEDQVKHRTAWEDTPLNLQQAAEESGYSADHLGRLVKDGEIPNAGRTKAPRILRKDLPRKPGVGLTPPPLRLHGPDARSVLHHGGVER